MSTRRVFIKKSNWSAGIIVEHPRIGENYETKKVIMLRSSWQTVNIRDIAHTPGVLALLEKYMPDVEVRLWPTSVAEGVEDYFSGSIRICRGPLEI